MDLRIDFFGAVVGATIRLAPKKREVSLNMMKNDPQRDNTRKERRKHALTYSFSLFFFNFSFEWAHLFPASWGPLFWPVLLSAAFHRFQKSPTSPTYHPAALSHLYGRWCAIHYIRCRREIDSEIVYAKVFGEVWINGMPRRYVTAKYLGKRYQLEDLWLGQSFWLEDRVTKLSET